MLLKGISRDNIIKLPGRGGAKIFESLDRLLCCWGGRPKKLKILVDCFSL